MQKVISLILIGILLFSNVSFGETIGFPVWNELDECVVQTSSPAITLHSQSALLMEMESGKVLYEFNAHEKLRPASVTKVMTILLIKEEIASGNILLTDVVTCSEKAMNMGGSQIWLDPKDQLTVDEMLKAICVVSANDCCVAMAEHISGSSEEFVVRMNRRAQELGMKDTLYKNCHGLDEDGHLTTAYDIALVSRELMTKFPEISAYSTIWMDSLRSGQSELTNTNKLVRTYKGITGLKTGSTSLAQFNISATATRDNLSLIAVTMKASTSKERFEDAQRLLDMGFANYKYEVLCKKDEVVRSLPVIKGKVDKIDVVTENGSSILLNKSENSGITKKEIINDSILAPVTKGTKVGEIVYYLGEKEVGRVNVITYYNIEKKSFADYFDYLTGTLLVRQK